MNNVKSKLKKFGRGLSANSEKKTPQRFTVGGKRYRVKEQLGEGR